MNKRSPSPEDDRNFRQSPGFQSPNYTQTPNDIFDELMPLMQETELRFVLALVRYTFGFHRSSTRLGISEISKLTGLSYNGVLAGASAAERRGLVRRTNPKAKTKAEWKLVTPDTPSTIEGQKHKHPQPVRVAPSLSEGQGRLNKDKEINNTYTADDFSNFSPVQAMKIHELRSFRDATGFFPGSPLYWLIYDAIRSHAYTVKQMRDVYAAWCGRGYNVRSIGWLIGNGEHPDWMHGIPQQIGTGAGKRKGSPATQQPKLSPSELENLREQARKELVSA